MTPLKAPGTTITASDVSGAVPERCASPEPPLTRETTAKTASVAEDDAAYARQVARYRALRGLPAAYREEPAE